MEKHIIFTEEQKNQLGLLFQGLTYQPFKTVFQFIKIKNNKWVLPESVLSNEDINYFIDKAGKRKEAQDVIDACEIREITEKDVLQVDL